MPEVSKNLPGQTTATLHVQWLETELDISVPVPTGQRTLLDLLPAARRISNEATTLAVGRAVSQGRQISCCAGCGACCRQLVVISVLEAQALAELVTAMPPERQAVIRRRFGDAVTRLEGAGLLETSEPKGERAIVAKDFGTRAATLRAVAERYWKLQIACPFLEDESCSIHPDRPTVCREHHVTTPAENCKQLYQVHVDRVDPPVRVGEVLARTTHRAGAGETFMIPLALSLEWSEANGETVRKPHDGKALFQMMVEELRVGT